MAHARPGVIRHNVCGQCSQSFVVRDFSNPRASRCPIVLTCGHPVCEFCLKGCMKQDIGITCGICKSVTKPTSEASNEVFEEFNPHMYLIGHMAIFNNRRMIDDSKLNFVPAGASSTCNIRRLMATDNQDSLDTCFECKFHKADCYCKNCEVSLCHNCWRKIHNSSQHTLRKHVKIPISKMKKQSRIEKMCPNHGQKLEFYCKGPNCQEVICSYCIVSFHQGGDHVPVPLKSKNDECLPRLKAVIEEAKLKRERLKHTLKKARPEQYVTKVTDVNGVTKLTEIEQEITRYFAQLHGLLQIEEEKALKAVNEARTVGERSVEQAQKESEANVENISGLLNEAQESTDEASLACVDLSSLIDRLVKATDVPCFLVEKKNEYCEPKVELNDDLKELIPKCCKLTISQANSFELRKEDDLPEDYVIESLEKEETSDRVSVAERISGLRDSPTLSVASNTPSLNRLSASEPKSRPVIAKNTTHHVVMAYIKDPGEFYTIFKNDERKRSSIEKRALDYLSQKNITPEKAEKDDLFLAHYDHDGNWYRARVKKVLPQEECKNNANIIIYYIDYGNEELVPLSKLRVMSEKLQTEPPLAMRCTFFDCIPKNDRWSAEATQRLVDFTKTAIITMYIMDIQQDGKLEIDLCTSNADEVIGNEIVSIRDAFIFLELANFVRGSTKTTNNSNNGGKYMSQILPVDGEEFYAQLGHVNNPADFYVQKLGIDMNYMNDMMHEMNCYFKTNSNKGMIYTPYVGMPCAAQFSLDETWYRAEILDLPGKSKVYVHYIDYGNREKLSYKSIRKLPKNFMKLAPQALRCCMDEIKPKNQKGWSDEARSFVTQLLEDKRLKVRVRGMFKDRVKVLVYNGEACLNALLVEKNFAVGTGPNVLTAEFLKPNVKDSVSKFQNKKNAAKKNKNRRFTAEELRAKHRAEKNADESSESEVEEAAKIAQLNDGLIRPEIKILTLHSPSLLYVSLVSAAPEYKKLQKNMNKFYKTLEMNESIEWKVGDFCAVYSTEKMKWFRGVVHDLIKDNKVEVYLKDFAKHEVVPVSNLKPLDQSFLKIPTAAYKCHLSGIKPASEEWPSLSCEFLSSEIENFSHIYFTKMGEIDKENNSMPIELWVKKITLGGALDPTKEEWITLNQLLVEQGLAIPAKVPDFNKAGKIAMQDFSFDFDTVDDTERKIWKSNKNVKNAHIFETETDSESIESEFSDPGSSVSALCSNYSNTFIPSVLSDWLLPERLAVAKFNGLATYVDHDAVIYMHDAVKDEEKLDMIRKSLSAVYANSKPESADLFWSPGQLCIVRYHLDNNWYRGKVLKVNEDLTYDVLFVDYGNVESCQIIEMRKSIKGANIPILCRKYTLQGIAPNSDDGKWTTAAIDYLHGLVVDKVCLVTITDEPYDYNLPAKVKMMVVEDHLDVAAIMVEMKHAVVVPENDSDESHVDSVMLIENAKVEASGKNKEKVTTPYLFDSTEIDQPTEWYALIKADQKLKKSARPKKIVESTPPEKEELKYKILEIPDKCTSVPIAPFMLLNKTEFIATLTEDNVPPILAQVVEDFKKMVEDLQKEGPNLPKLTTFEKGTPCCCIYSDDDEWYRAEIKRRHSQDDNLVEVVYVDYGNNEMKKIDDLRICKKEWLNVPKMSLRLRLFNVKRNPEIERIVFAEAFEKCVLLPEVFAKIIVKNIGFLEVEVYNAATGELAYQEMIDNNFLFEICPSDSTDKEVDD